MPGWDRAFHFAPGKDDRWVHSNQACWLSRAPRKGTWWYFQRTGTSCQDNSGELQIPVRQVSGLKDDDHPSSVATSRARLFPRSCNVGPEHVGRSVAQSVHQLVKISSHDFHLEESSTAPMNFSFERTRPESLACITRLVVLSLAWQVEDPKKRNPTTYLNKTSRQRNFPQLHNCTPSQTDAINVWRECATGCTGWRKRDRRLHSLSCESDSLQSQWQRGDWAFDSPEFIAGLRSHLARELGVVQVRI